MSQGQDRSAHSVLVDTSVWFPGANIRDHNNARAKQLLSGVAVPLLTDHVLIETWGLLNIRIHREAAEQFWSSVRLGGVRCEKVTDSDWETAWEIGRAFPDQDFSIVDRTSFAVMERLGIKRAASFDHHFAIYRYGPGRKKAFDIIND